MKKSFFLICFIIVITLISSCSQNHVLVEDISVSLSSVEFSKEKYFQLIGQTFDLYEGSWRITNIKHNEMIVIIYITGNNFKDVDAEIRNLEIKNILYGKLSGM